MDEILVIIEPLPEIKVQVEGTLSVDPTLPDLLTFYELSKI